MNTTLFPALEPSGAAIFSPCGRYRYLLTRTWADANPARLCNFLMLNPSTADAETSDPTVTRCVNFARGWGYDGLVVTNLFALRSTDPEGLIGDFEPVGPNNDRVIVETARNAALVVCAWGVWGRYAKRQETVLDLLGTTGKPLHCLRKTKHGWPAHPLYLPARLTPIPMEVR